MDQEDSVDGNLGFQMVVVSSSPCTIAHVLMGIQMQKILHKRKILLVSYICFYLLYLICYPYDELKQFEAIVSI